MLIRGTTVHHTFTIPEDLIIVKCRIIYTQNKKVIIKKEDNDIIIDTTNHTVSTTLSQVDTLKFKFHPEAQKNICQIQLHVLDDKNEASASIPINERIGDCLDGEILSEV